MTVTRISRLWKDYVLRSNNRPDETLSRIAAIEAGLGDEQTFVYLVRYEQRKCHRSNQPLSAVRICFDAQAVAREFDGSSSRDFWRAIFRAVRRFSRDTDLKFFRDEVLLLVLPDTNKEGALKARDRLLDLLHVEVTEIFPAAEIDRFVRAEIISPFDVDNLPGGRSGVFGRSDHGKRDDHDSNGCVRNRSVGTRPFVRSNRLSVDAVAKRFVDIVGACLGVFITLPMWFLIAVSIKLSSPGPVFFRQERVGLLGRRFTFLKFRTMRFRCDDRVHRDYVNNYIKGDNHLANLGSEDEPFFKVVEDPRVTRVGVFLRKWSLDELPQLLNIIAGDMSLVGPRPPIPYELDIYQYWHFERLRTKPGLTGLWQVEGRSRTTFDDMVRMDLRYVKSRSLLLDIRLMLGTFGAVLSRSGAV